MSIWKMDLEGRLPGWLGVVYDFIADEVTGHSTHAINGLVPCALLALPYLFIFDYLVYLTATGVLYTGAVYFYTMREKEWNSPADNVGDVIWVYTLWLALLLPWWQVALVGGSVCLAYDIWYWSSRPAPGWMDMAIWR